MEIGIFNSGSPVDVGQSSCDDIVVSSVCNANCAFVNIDFMTDVTSGHYDLLYKAEDIPDHVAADSLDSIPGTDSWNDLRQLSVMNMMPADQSAIRVDLPFAFGDIDINSELLFPGGQFQEPWTNIRPISLFERIPCGTLVFPDASTFTDNFYGGRDVHAGNSMPLAVPPYELGSHLLYDTSSMHEPSRHCEPIVTSSYSDAFLDTLFTSPPRDDGSIQTRAMRV